MLTFSRLVVGRRSAHEGECRRWHNWNARVMGKQEPERKRRVCTFLNSQSLWISSGSTDEQCFFRLRPALYLFHEKAGGDQASTWFHLSKACGSYDEGFPKSRRRIGSICGYETGVRKELVVSQVWRNVYAEQKNLRLNHKKVTCNLSTPDIISVNIATQGDSLVLSFLLALSFLWECVVISSLIPEQLFNTIASTDLMS